MSQKRLEQDDSIVRLRVIETVKQDWRLPVANHPLLPEDEAFFRKIAANPADRSIRLAYADWLAETGDHLADLIRLEEEMRCLPFFSDRYWELKPRRNALRTRSDTEWLLRMNIGDDHEPLCKEVPRGWRNRWRLLREFTERWHGLPMADVGGNSDEVKKTEDRLGLQLPPAMREWVAFSFELGENFPYLLRDCYDVVDLADLNSVSVMIAGEADRYWAVKKDNLQSDDPPVDWYRRDYNPPYEGFVYYKLFAPSLTSFVFRQMEIYLGNCGVEGGKTVSFDNPTAGPFLFYLRDVFGWFPDPF